MLKYNINITLIIPVIFQTEDMLYIQHDIWGSQGVSYSLLTCNFMYFVDRH
jgi:hypothetical protein